LQWGRTQVSASDEYYRVRFRVVCREWGIDLEPKKVRQPEPPGEVSHDIYSVPLQPRRSRPRKPRSSFTRRSREV